MEYDYQIVGALDSGKLLEFYYRNIDKMIRPRPEEVIRNAVENGAFFDVEDYERNIAGAAGAYEYLEHKYIEIGSTKILSEIQGYGLHKLFITSRLLNTIYFMPPEECIFCAIKPDNEKSIHSVSKMGFVKWNPPGELVNARRELLMISSGESLQFMRFEPSKENMSIISSEFLFCLKRSLFKHRENEKPAIKVNIYHEYLTSQEAIDELEGLILR